MLQAHRVACDNGLGLCPSVGGLLLLSLGLPAAWGLRTPPETAVVDASLKLLFLLRKILRAEPCTNEHSSVICKQMNIVTQDGYMTCAARPMLTVQSDADMTLYDNRSSCFSAVAERAKAGQSPDSASRRRRK